MGTTDSGRYRFSLRYIGTTTDDPTVEDWNGEQQLADHFEKHPELAVAYGFVDDDPTAQPETVRSNPPAQSRLWEMWHEEFNDELQDIYRNVAFELVELARKEGIPAPDDVFRPDEPLGLCGRDSR